MTTALITHKSALDHVTPHGHPERVERIARLYEEFAAPAYASLLRAEAPAVEDAAILRAHPPEYLASLKARIPSEGFAAIDPDTHLSPASWQAVLRGAGAAVRAVDMVMANEAQNAFSMMRPPGHHAEKSEAMGFCFLGNVAIAAKHALDHHGLSRVAILDFDVHHGNGTQDLVWDDARIAFSSSHQMPLYPGTGRADERGAHGNILNIPLPGLADGAAFRAAMQRLALPFLRDHRPELLFISAGFDAHRLDPLANLNLEGDDFHWITAEICKLAQEFAQGRVVSVLEGGYSLDGLADGATAHMRALMEAGE
ncbi:MAG: histone deacetylase family protein [Paracoccaceae bacterium]